MIDGVEVSTAATDVIDNLLRLHAMGEGSEQERRFHHDRVKNATHQVGFRQDGKWIFAPLKWCGAKGNSILKYSKNKSPVTDHFKPKIINAGFKPIYPHDKQYEMLYSEYVAYCDNYGFIHSDTEVARTFYVREMWSEEVYRCGPADSSIVVNLDNITTAEDCHVTRVWGFSPEDWGALGFPKDGTARRLANQAERYFVICFVSHYKSRHIADGDEGLVHGVYELSNELVNLENDNVLAASHFDNDDNYLNGNFRWPLGLRAVRAWRFLNPPMTKASMPTARSKSWDVSTSIVPIDRNDFDLLCQYKLEQVSVFGNPLQVQRLANPIAIPCHVYLFACEDPKLLAIMPQWQKGEVLVKIGCTSDVEGRLASFNDDPLSRLFNFRLGHMTNDLVGEDAARQREIELLKYVADIGRCATERLSEFFFVKSNQLPSLIAKFTRAKKVA
ncbi:hypothetical protein [Novosphingobium aquimarinum]|uniref:hypothetical protein n=1 Tax=Novosphingobium aquimarinum TaxID=2682494 RepID=UPI0012EBEE5D|nr:hypothetical protein [Novosphingobium aquimarinum]